MALVKPFRALRYDERRAGPLDSLVAPPYDVISPEERARYLASSPHNVVRLTLPEDEVETARTLAEWEREGVLVRDEEPALWWLAQDYTGPDGVARRRDGLVAALRVEPYSTGTIQPHERTHAGPKEGRLRLLRALRTHVEPIFLLYEGTLTSATGEPAMDVELEGVRSRLWRVEGEPPAELADASLLIADGHHRYETALAFHEAAGTEASAWMLVVIVPTEQKGLTIFPTHRIAREPTPLPPLEARPADGLPFAEVYTQAGSGYPARRRRRARHRTRRPVRARRPVHAVRRRGESGGRSRGGGSGVPAQPAHGRAGGSGRRCRQDDAPEEHVLLPQAHLGSALHAAR